MEGFDQSAEPVTFRVVRYNWIFYGVERVIEAPSHFPAGPGILVRKFWRYNQALACAKGLAEKTWTRHGPIMAEFKPLTTPPTPPEGLFNDDPE
jgi:hypothetical protein